MNNANHDLTALASALRGFAELGPEGLEAMARNEPANFAELANLTRRLNVEVNALVIAWAEFANVFVVASRRLGGGNGTVN